MYLGGTDDSNALILGKKAISLPIWLDKSLSPNHFAPINCIFFLWHLAASRV